MSALPNMLKGISGEPELARILWAIGVLALIVYQGLAIWLNKQNFSAIEFGGGFASILVAGGFGVAAKDKGVAKARATTGETDA